MVDLYPEQQRALYECWSAFVAGDTHVLCVAPTGGGKTEIMIEFIKRAGCSTLILCGKKELAEQLASRLKADGIFSASLNEKSWGHVTVGTVGTVARAIAPPQFKLIIIDECHAVNDDEESIYQKAMGLFPEAKFLGFTATPYGIYGEGKFWPKISALITLDEMWRLERIVKPVMRASKEQFDLTDVKIRGGDYVLSDLERVTCDDEKIKTQVADALPKLKGRNKVVWACTSIQHAEMVSDKIFASVCVHSKLSKQVREANLREFEQGSATHLVFVTIVSEGYNYPAIDAVVFMRPTRSAKLYVQTVGRGLRKFPGKEDCLVLDYGRVVEHLGPINRVRVPEGRRAGAGESNESQLWLCAHCFTYNEMDKDNCVECDTERPVREVTKSLTKTAASGDIVTDKPYTRERVDFVQVDKHISKAGRVCIKLTYTGNGIFRANNFLEFFMEWNWHLGRQRLKSLGFPDLDFNDALEWITQGIVLSDINWIEWVENGKYKKVVNVGKDD